MANANAPHYPGKDLEAMSFAVNYHRWIVDEFGPFLGKRVAEVGAGMGSVSKLLLEKPIDRLVAFEPSPDMYPHLERELRGETRAEAVQGFFSRRNADDRFDSVMYLNVLEHITDDGAELKAACEALVPHGHLLLFVPAFGWLYSDLDRRIGHVRRYTMGDLRRVVGAAGLAVVRARYFDVAGILPWYVRFVLLRGSISPRSVSLYDHLVVPVARWIEGALPPPLGKNLLLVGRKR